VYTLSPVASHTSSVTCTSISVAAIGENTVTATTNGPAKIAAKITHAGTTHKLASGSSTSTGIRRRRLASRRALK
jgi:hypothetical protein